VWEISDEFLQIWREVKIFSSATPTMPRAAKKPVAKTAPKKSAAKKTIDKTAAQKTTAKPRTPKKSTPKKSTPKKTPSLQRNSTLATKATVPSKLRATHRIKK